jgi:outer membrane protein
MNALKRFFAVAAFAIAGFSAFGEGLTLADARSLALASSKTLSSLGLSVESAALDEKLQSYDALPSLSASASASASTPTADQTVMDTASVGVSASVSWTLFDGGSGSILSSIDSLATSAAKESARAEYYSVLDSVDSAWYSLMEAYAARDAAESSAEEVGLALSIATIRLESGAISMTDFLEVESESAAKQTAVTKARRDVSVRSLSLASLIGKDTLPAVEETDFSRYETLVAKLASFTDADALTFIGNALEAATAGNAGLAKSAIASEKAALSTSLAKAAYLPTVSAGVTGSLGYSPSTGETTQSARVSLSANVSLDAWKTAASVAKAKLAQERASLDLEETSRSLAVNVGTAVYDCVAQAQTVVSSAKSLEYAERHYSNVLEQYRLSAASASDLSDAASLVSSGRNSLIEARYGFLSVISTLRTLVAAESDAATLALIP